MKLRRIRSRGFFSYDAVAGLVLVTAVASILSVALFRQSKAATRLGDARADDRRLEAALLGLQTSAAAESPGVTLRRLQTPAPAGRAWVELSLAGRAGASGLIGQVPKDAAGRFTSAPESVDQKGAP